MTPEQIAEARRLNSRVFDVAFEAGQQANSAEVRALRADLNAYGDHQSTCTVRLYPHRTWKACDCGWSAAQLALAAPQPTAAEASS